MVSAASKKLLKELPSKEEMQATFFSLTSKTDHILAITGAAYLEKALETVLVLSFRTMGSEDHVRMFDGSAGGVLGTANAKIRLAYANWILDEDQYQALKLINDIRNVFSHTLHPVGFDHPHIKEDCAKLVQFASPLTKAFPPDDAKQIYTGLVFYLYGLLTGMADDIASRKRKMLARLLMEGVPPKEAKTARPPSPDTPPQQSRKIRRRTAASKKPQRPPGSSGGTQ